MLYLISPLGTQTPSSSSPDVLLILALVIFALLFFTGPFDGEQLYYILVGAVAYYFLQRVGISPLGASHGSPHVAKVGSPHVAKVPPSVGQQPPPQPRTSRRSSAQDAPDRPEPLARERQMWRIASPIDCVEVLPRTHSAPAPSPSFCGLALPRTHSAPAKVLPRPQPAPPASLSFCGVGLRAEVDELLCSLAALPETERSLCDLAGLVQDAIRPLIPESEVVVLATGALPGGSALVLDAPEVDIVLSVCPHVLVSRLQGRLSKGGSVAMLDARKLQKSAVRACTDRLVAPGLGFKFRRTGFRCPEPKVTLLAPLGPQGAAVPADFSVNSILPLHAAALAEECGRSEPRTTLLMLLVRRWAQRRLICQSVNGHLSPYAWSLLVVYFLQVREDGPLLPPVAGVSSQRAQWVARQHRCKVSLDTAKVAAMQRDAAEDAESNGHVSELLKLFVRFYHARFDWRAEAISVRLAQRAPPETGRSLHTLEDGTRVPYIEDPFDRSQDLGEGMTSASLARLRAEFGRADKLLACDGSLVDLLEIPAP